jgi:hypothetical protein
LPEDYLKDLSKELMLPRQMMSHQQVSRNDLPKHTESNHALMRNNFMDKEIDIDEIHKPKYN